MDVLKTIEVLSKSYPKSGIQIVFFIGKLIECEIEIDYCEMTVVNAQHFCKQFWEICSEYIVNKIVNVTHVGKFTEQR